MSGNTATDSEGSAVPTIPVIPQPLAAALLAWAKRPPQDPNEADDVLLAAIAADTELLVAALTYVYIKTQAEEPR